MKRRMSVGIVCFPSLGGSGVVASELAVGLAERGHTVHLISRRPLARPLPQCDRLSFHAVELSDYPLFEYPPYTVALASTLIDLTRAHGLDLINVHYAVPHAMSAYLARQALGKGGPRVITSLHGTDVMMVGSHPAYRSVTRFAVAASDGIIVPSAYLKNEGYRLLELPSDAAVEIIPNFVDTDRFAPAEAADRAVFKDLFDGADVSEGPVLFHVSNFRPVKQVEHTLEVLARVRARMPARLVLVGDGPERAGAQRRAQELGLSDFVRFLGKRDDFAAQLRHADGFVLPSSSESFGVAALEALSSGVPVFGYEVGGLPELVTPEVGRLVALDDLDALAQAVLAAMGDPPGHQALRRAARQRAQERFRAAPAFDRYEAYMRRVVESVPGSEER